MLLSIKKEFLQELNAEEIIDRFAHSSSELKRLPFYAAVAQWLTASNIFRRSQYLIDTGSMSRWFYQSGFEFAKTPLLILNH